MRVSLILSDARISVARLFEIDVNVSWRGPREEGIRISGLENKVGDARAKGFRECKVDVTHIYVYKDTSRGVWRRKFAGNSKNLI